MFRCWVECVLWVDGGLSYFFVVEFGEFFVDLVVFIVVVLDFVDN